MEKIKVKLRSVVLDFVLINLIYILLFLPGIYGFHMEILFNFISITALWVGLRGVTGPKSGTTSPCLNLNLSDTITTISMGTHKEGL